MDDPNRPPPAPGMVQTMGAPTGQSFGSATPGGVGFSMGGFGGNRNGPFGGLTGAGLPNMPLQNIDPANFPQGFDPSRMQQIMGALQGFRDARNAWREGGRVGERPTARGFFGPMLGALGGRGGGSVGGPLNGGGIPGGAPGPATSGMYGSQLGVAGAIPATSGFDLPDY
jgi:hypothetical protein